MGRYSEAEPLLTVVVPVYNVERELPRCVESIRNQTESNIRIILINDGSTDGCPAMCDEYAAKDKRVSVIHQQNRGVSAARNVGIGYTDTPYIMFFDSDDYVEPNICEKMIETISKHKTGMAICGYTRWNGRTAKRLTHEGLPNILIGDDHKDYSQCIKGTTVMAVGWNKIYRMDIINKKESEVRFREEIGSGEDTLFNLHYLLIESSIAICHEALYHYVERNNSITRRGGLKLNEIEGYRWAYKEFVRVASEDENVGVYIQFAPRWLLEGIAHCFNGKVDSKGRKSVKQRFLEVCAYPETLDACRHSGELKHEILRFAIVKKNLLAIKIYNVLAKIYHKINLRLMKEAT